MSDIELRLLGGFELRGRDVGLPGSLGTRKTRALFAYLALHAGQPLRREALSAMLWGRSGEKQAANSLNQALYSMRKQLPGIDGSILVADQEHVWFKAGAIDNDAREFEALASSGDPASLEAAWNLYRGPLLDGYDLPETVFTDWLRMERSRLENLAVTIGGQLLTLKDDSPDDSSSTNARRLLDIDPCNEAGHRHLMRYHYLQGQPHRALRQYEQCAELLRNELHIAPSVQTRDLADRIRSGDLDVTAAKAPASGRLENPADPSAAKPAMAGNRLAMVITGALAVVGAAVYLLLPWQEARIESVPTTKPRLAVMPFEKVSGSTVDETFAQGLADDITTELAKIPGFTIIARQSAGRLAAKGGYVDESEASHVLRGRIRQQDARFVLNTWLVDTRKQEQIWAERYAGLRSELPAFQERVISGVREALLVELGAPGSPIMVDAGTDHPQAYDFYLKGLTAYYRTTPDGHAEAAQAFQRALDLDPSFAKARTGLAAIYFDAASGKQDYAQTLDISWIEAYLRMKELLASGSGHDIAQSDILASSLALHRRDHAGAVRHARSALSKEPGNARAMEALAEVLIYSGKFEEGEELARWALLLNPATSSRPTYLLALAAFGRGDIDGAIQLGERAVSLAEFPVSEVNGLLAAVHGISGNPDAAEEYLASYIAALEERPRNVWRTVNRDFTNPRRTTWLRPTLSAAVYGYPFANAAILARLADGFEAAGIAGTTLGYFPAGTTVKLAGNEIRSLLFEHTIEGRGILDLAETWSQSRSASGDLVQSGGLGTILLAERGTSRVRDDQLCDQWVHNGMSIESCASVFKLFEGTVSPIDGTHLLATEFGPFVVSHRETDF